MPEVTRRRYHGRRRAMLHKVVKVLNQVLADHDRFTGNAAFQPFTGEVGNVSSLIAVATLALDDTVTYTLP